MQHSRAQIVATIGPASKDVRTISKMIKHQMDVARLNFSHGTHAEHARYIKNIRLAGKKMRRKIPIIQDLSGPRIKTKSGHRIASSFKDLITQKDIKDLQFGINHGVDYVIMSYIGDARDIQALKKEMAKLGAIKPIIAKVERAVALKNLGPIIKAADAVMIGRGDLVNEVPLEEIPFIETKIIKQCKKSGKPVITATQMMLSMVENPTPTRAEATDVAFAITSGSDAVMLSEETAIGQYPIQTVQIMERIVLAAEKHLGKHEVNRLT